MPVSESSCVARVSHEAGSELSPPLPPLPPTSRRRARPLRCKLEPWKAMLVPVAGEMLAATAAQTARSRSAAGLMAGQLASEASRDDL